MLGRSQSKSSNNSMDTNGVAVPSVSLLSSTQHQIRNTALSRHSWKLWILWSPSLLEKSKKFRQSDESNPFSKDTFVKLHLDLVETLGKVIPNGIQVIEEMKNNYRDFTVVEVIQPPTSDGTGNLLIRTPVQVITNSLQFTNPTPTELSGVKLLTAYKDLAEFAQVLFTVGDIIILFRCPITEDDQIWLNHEVIQSECQIIYLMNKEISEPDNFKKPFGDTELVYQSLTQKIYVEGDTDPPCTLLRIFPLNRLPENVLPDNRVTQNESAVSVIGNDIQCRKRDHSSSPQKIELNEKSKLTATPNGEALPKKSKTGGKKGRRRRERTPSSAESFTSDIEEVDLASDAEDRTRQNQENHENCGSAQDEDEEDFNHFETTPSRSVPPFPKRRSQHLTRIEVPQQEGGFLRERLDESIYEEEQNPSTAPLAPTIKNTEWHPGRRPKLEKRRQVLYNYKTLKELEKELIETGGINKMIPHQEYLYGVVNSVVYSPEAGSFRLRISDDSGKHNVLVRLHITEQDLTVGPKPHKNDIIRIHRACVQFESNEMVVSTAPHRNYTLFNYRHNLVGKIEMATTAKSINYIEADQKRVIALREFIKLRMEEELERNEYESENEQNVYAPGDLNQVFEDMDVVNEDSTESETSQGQGSFIETEAVAQSQRIQTRSQLSNETNLTNPNRPRSQNSNVGTSSEIATNFSSGVLSSELRTQSQGNGNEVTFERNYVLDRTILDEHLELDESNLLEELAKDQKLFNFRFWSLNCMLDAQEDLFVLRATDGTQSRFHHFVNLISEEQEKVEIKPCYLELGENTQIISVAAPTVDVRITNASKNPELIEKLMCINGNPRVRYILKHVCLANQPGPFSRKYKNMKLEVDASSTSVALYDGEDRFTGMQVQSIRKKVVPSSSRSSASPQISSGAPSSNTRQSKSPSVSPIKMSTRSSTSSSPVSHSRQSNSQVRSPNSNAASSSYISASVNIRQRQSQSPSKSIDNSLSPSSSTRQRNSQRVSPSPSKSIDRNSLSPSSNTRQSKSQSISQNSTRSTLRNSVSPASDTRQRRSQSPSPNPKSRSSSSSSVISMGSAESSSSDSYCTALGSIRTSQGEQTVISSSPRRNQILQDSSELILSSANPSVPNVEHSSAWNRSFSKLKGLFKK